MGFDRLLRLPLLRVLSTLMLLALAVLAGRALWRAYMDGPWTRDGRIRADVVAVAPDVSGLVAAVAVADNQFVHRGDLLLRVDPARFTQALAQADALVARRRAELDMRRRQLARRAGLDNDVVSGEDRDNAAAAVAQAQAGLAEAQAQRETARIDLARTAVRAPVDGWVSNLAVYAGEFAQAGRPALAVVDRGSFWVYGYFEENRLPGIHVGDAARMTLLGTDIVLDGHVQSLAHGITDRDNAAAGQLLADVNPSFNWVRLAQRIPVRIHIDRVPPGVQLAAGMSCSIVVRRRAAAP